MTTPRIETYSQLAAESILKILSKLEDEETRLETFNKIHQVYCFDCGSHSGFHCCCKRDE